MVYYVLACDILNYLWLLQWHATNSYTSKSSSKTTHKTRCRWENNIITVLRLEMWGQDSYGTRWGI